MKSKTLEWAVILDPDTAKGLRGLCGFSHPRDQDDPPIGTMCIKTIGSEDSEAFDVVVYTRQGHLFVAQVEQRWMAEAIIKAAAARPRKAKTK